jgi:asparaginyl-tRNA synthetase
MAPDEKTYYVDEKAGEDDVSRGGSRDQPYRSVAFAYLQHGEAQYQVRDAEAAEGWKPGM